VKDITKVKYSKDVDALLIEFSDKKIDYAEDKGHSLYIIQPKESLYYRNF